MQSFQAPVLHQQAVNVTNLSSLIIADFNNDHKLDLVVAEGNAEFALLLGNGDGSFVAPVYVFDGDGGPIVSGDFNGDGNLDIAEAGSSGLAILLGNGDGTFKPVAFPYTSSLSSVLAGDLNGDGKVDIVSGTGGEIQVFVSNGDGTFDAPAPVSSTGMGVALADLNGDGKLDVVTTGYGGGSAVVTSIYLGNGDGTIDPSAIDVPYRYFPHSPLPSVQIAEMNGDGKLDLIIESPISTAFVLLNSTQTMPPPSADFTIAAAPGSPTSQTIAAGQKATFNLTFGAVAGFSGSVSLKCSISPTVNPPATCELSSSSVQVGSTSQTLTVAVSTTGSSVSGLSPIGLPPEALPLAWVAIMLGSGWLLLRNRRRLLTLAAPLVVAFASLVGCGGSGSPTHIMGTSTGTYSATITASSGSLSHNMILKVIVQ